MKRIITCCVLIFYLGFAASFPFAFPGEYNYAFGGPQPQYQQYHTFAQPQPQYKNVVTSPTQTFVKNAFNNAYPNTQQLPNVVQNRPFVNAQQNQNYQRVLAPALPSPQQIQQQIAAEIKEQQTKQAIEELASQIRAQSIPVSQPSSSIAEPYINNLPSVKGPAAQWTQADTTARAQQQQPAISLDTVNPYAQLYQHVLQRPQHNYDQQFFQSWKQLIQQQQQAPNSQKFNSEKKRYLVIHPDGRTEYVDKIESIKNSYPNHMLVNIGQLPTNPISSQSGVPQQGPQQPVPNILRQTPQNPQQIQPDNVQTGQQSQPTSDSQLSNTDPQNPLESLILNSTPTQSAPQSVSVGEQTTAPLSNPPQTQNNPSDSNLSHTPSSPDSPVKSYQPSDPSGVTQPHPSIPKDQTQPKISDARSKTQLPPSDIEQPQKSEPSVKSTSHPSPEDQTKPLTPDTSNQPQPLKETDEPKAETDSPDNQPQPQPINPKEPGQTNVAPELANPTNQITDLSDQAQSVPTNADEHKEPQPTDTTPPQPTDSSPENEHHLSNNEAKPLKEQDDAIPQNTNNPNSPTNKPNAGLQNTPPDKTPEKKSVPLKQKPIESPGKIVLIDSTGLTSRDLPNVDSEILSNLFGENPYTFIQFFLVRPERTLERKVTRMHLGDSHILEEITESDQYGDGLPTVTSESHLIPIPKH